MKNNVVNLLLSLSRTNALQCLIALWALGPLPVTQTEIVEKTGESQESIKKGLQRLKALGMAVCSDGKHLTGWQLTPLVQQLPLPLSLLDQYADLAPAQPGLPASHIASAPLHAGLPDDGSPIEQARGAHAQLQAGNAALDAANVPNRGIDSAESAESDGSILILLNESTQIVDSNNKNTLPAIPKNRQSKTDQRDPRHIRAILGALAVRGLPVRNDDDPFPTDLRLCVNALVKLSCPRKRAELVVARSRWDSGVILKEIARWKAHKNSTAGASITLSGFPFLVAARIENCEPCPTYAYHESDLEQPEAQPNPPEDPTPEQPEPVEGAGPSALPQSMHGPITPANAEHWQTALDQLRLEMSPSTFFDTGLLDTWIAHIEGEAYHIAVANQYARDWLDNRLNATVTRVLKNIVGHDVTVRFVAPGDPPEHS